MAKTMKCARCGKRYRGSGDWNATMEAGVVVSVLCPACQTPDENAEAEINGATTVYGRDALNRVRGLPKVGDDGS